MTISKIVPPDPVMSLKCSRCGCATRTDEGFCDLEKPFTYYCKRCAIELGYKTNDVNEDDGDS